MRKLIALALVAALSLGCGAAGSLAGGGIGGSGLSSGAISGTGTFSTWNAFFGSPNRSAPSAATWPSSSSAPSRPRRCLNARRKMG